MKTIAVIFGGKSTEHDISIVTALSGVIKPLEITGQYHVEAIYIAKDGSWYWDDRLKDISLYSSGGISDFIERASPASVVFGGGMAITKPAGRFGKAKSRQIDVVFPATHGTYGEDGSLMGLLRMAGVPFVGCDMEASVIAMNKLLSHQVVAAAGIDQHRYIGLRREEFEHASERVLERFEHMTLPLFVKPVHLGSSIGITRVSDSRELYNALEVAFHYDTVVIVEESVPHLIEVTLPIIGSGDNVRPALLERPMVEDGETFDFNTKYMNQGKGGKKSGSKGTAGSQGYSEFPAKLEEDLYVRAERLGLAVYRAIGCEGIARVDMLIDALSRKVYFNEINPLPGSLYAHNWRASGLSTVDLVTKLIEFAESRAEKQHQQATTFTTNFLKQF